MKHLIIIILCAVSFSAKAQTVTITNNERCAITVQQFCFKKPVCAASSPGTIVTVACCGGTATISIPTCTPTPPMYSGFQVCWSSTLCTPLPCTYIVTNNNPFCYGPTATLPGCADCASPNINGTIVYNPLTQTLSAN
ncbi:MAG: hypothetical protein H0X33_06850 [Taibaiella sp.]|nr:hypothetical protein [Taibaiella sp.]